MALLMQHIQGDIRSHLLLTENLAKPHFEDAATPPRRSRTTTATSTSTTTTLQEYMGTTTKGKGYTSDYPSYHKGKGRYGSRPYNFKGEEKATKNTTAITVTTTTVDPKEASATTAEEKAKENDQKENHHSTTFHHYHHTKERDQQKENEKEQTLCATTVENPGIHPTSVGGKDKSTTLTNHNIDQSQLVCSVPNDNQPQQLKQLPLHSSISLYNNHDTASTDKTGKHATV
eukprot:6050506-Amphidinium_carterae.3